MTLGWATSNATTVTIGDIGLVGPSGSHVVSPPATRIYTLTATGLGGVTTASVTATVTVPPPPPPPPPDPLAELQARVAVLIEQVAALEAQALVLTGQRDVALTDQTALKTKLAVISNEATAALKRNASLKINSRLPKWATDALTKIANLSKE